MLMFTFTYVQRQFQFPVCNWIAFLPIYTWDNMKELMGIVWVLTMSGALLQCPCLHLPSHVVLKCLKPPSYGLTLCYFLWRHFIASCDVTSCAVCLVPVEPEAELQGHSFPLERQPRVSSPHGLLHIQTGM